MSFLRNINRRHFLVKVLSVLGAGFFLKWLPSLKNSHAHSGRKSMLVSVHHDRASDLTDERDNKNLDEQVIKQMLDEGIKSFTGERNLLKAWSKIIPDPAKRVAIKINCQIQGIYTKSKVVKAVTDGLIQRGVRPDNIVIYDKTDHAFRYAGFEKNLGPGIKVGTVDDLGGYHRFLFNRMAKLLTGGIPLSENKYRCDYLINVPVLKALEGYSGVSLSMKNHYGSIGNPSHHHKDIMEFLPHLNAQPQIRDKTRLIVLDAIFVEYKWINGRDQKYVDPLNQLIISDDPVAIDYTGWKIIDKKRKEHGLEPVSPAPVFIQTAADRGLGTTNPRSIHLSL
ncbi:MAG: DUF362 domain-containing protein [Deltaproteobacteria bacterium]|nr:DUF362 domain-containing protein [Deltaproteobacteria bacterium]